MSEASNRRSIADETMLVYRENGKNHLPGPNPGTPYTICGLDAGGMERREHPITHAALWCSDCFAEHLGYDKEKPRSRAR